MTQNSVNSKQPLVQYVYTQKTTATTVNSAIPKDNTIPQNTEGVEVITCTITPTSATNLLFIRTNLSFYAANQTDVQIALFKDATANALAAMECQYLNAAGWAGQSQLLYSMVAGTTSATTFKIRCGRGSAVNVTVNRAQFGGVETNFLEIMEIKV